MPDTPFAQQPWHGPPDVAAAATPRSGAAPAGAAGRATGLPPYSGPGGWCPKCQVPGAASTEWHWAEVALPSGEQHGRVLACGELGLLGTPADGEHLCRQCTSCGYGWTEAVAAPAAARCGRLVPVLAVPGICLVTFLACAGAAGFLSRLLAGAALTAAYLAAAAVIAAVVVTLSVMAARHQGKRRGR